MIRKLKAIERQKIDIMDDATAAFMKSLDRSLSRLNTKVQGFIGDLEAGERLATSSRNLTRAVNSQAQIEEMLLEAGYRDSTERLMAAYDRVAALTLDAGGLLGIKDAFSEVDVRALTALKDIDMSRWEALGGDLVRDIHASIVEAVIGGSSVSDLQDAIEARLRGIGENDAAVARRAETLANTLTSSFDRTVSNRMAKKAGIDTFVYLGPDDDVTRPFCAAVLHGEGDSDFNIPSVDSDPPIYTSEQIAEMDNGQGLPVDQYGGGYQCRHSFRPISVEAAQEVFAS